MRKTLLFLSLLLTSMMSWAEKSGTCGTNLTWTLTSDGTELTISGTGKMNDCSFVSDNGVTRTNAPWGDSYKTIKSLIVKEGVTSIGKSAFRHCISLSMVSLPNTLTAIDNVAFADCYALSSIELPNSITTIGSDAFSDSYNLESIILPDSISEISEYTFSGCYSLKTVNIPNSVKKIGTAAFSGCM